MLKAFLKPTNALDENDYDRKNRYNYEKAKRFGYYNEIF